MNLQWLASFRLRLLLRATFLALAVAIAAMAAWLLREEKQRSHDHYRESAGKTLEQISARLRHPAGQLALLNPARSANAPAGAPLVLPFAALDFDDQRKVRSAVEMAGCLSPAENGTALCVAVGNSAWTGGYVYAVASLRAPALQAHSLGDERLDGAHHLRVRLDTPQGQSQWLAPYEVPPLQTGTAQHGRFTGYVPRDSGNYKGARPVRDFRAWWWQEGDCSNTPDNIAPGTESACPRMATLSLRLPVPALQQALFSGKPPTWPPADLAQYRLHLELLAPEGKEVLYDSDAQGVQGPWALASMGQLLRAGERLRIGRQGQWLADLQAPVDPDTRLSLLGRFVHWLPIERAQQQLQLQDAVQAGNASYTLLFEGSALGVDQALTEVAARQSWFVGGMLVAVALVWLVIEVGLIRPIARLTRRTRGLAHTLQNHADGLERFDLADLRGGNEMGLLASALDELLRRVKDDTQRARLRAQQEKDMWHAVGHEILSPLQSLLVLHPSDTDPSARYLRRMQQAVRVLYGQASPSEALQASTLRLQTLELRQFLQQVVDNADLQGLQLDATDDEVWVGADEFGLEDVLSHILSNAQRHRTPGTPITLVLRSDATRATLEIHNQGEAIAPDMVARVFEYGVSGADASDNTRRGQGLFVVKTYMAKMGGSVEARNTTDGVCLALSLPKSAPGSCAPGSAG